MIDRSSRFILVLIAIGLWMNVAVTFLRPLPVSAQSQASTDELREILTVVQSIRSEVVSIKSDTEAIKATVQTH